MRLICYIVYFFVLKIVRKESLGMYIKNICEKMGVVYIKLAQILSTRSDIFKDEKSRNDLCLINDSCNVLKFEEIERILKVEYGNKLYNIFKSIEKEPIGSASVSQVHKAILKNGEEVAIKVKRQDILKNASTDIRNIKILLRLLGIFSRTIRFLLKSTALDIYLKWIIKETDFVQEKENIKSMYNYHIALNNIPSLKHNKRMLLVKLYENICTDNVIVMQYIPYPTVNKIELNDKNTKMLKDAVNSYLQFYFCALFNFEDVTFHGDPHSGNIFIDEEGNIGFLDFGLVFRFEKWQLEVIKKLCIYMYTKNFDKLYEMILKVSGKYGFSYKDRKKEEKLKSDLRRFLLKIDGLWKWLLYLLRIDFIHQNITMNLEKHF